MHMMSTNRINTSGFAYDAAGNLTNSGVGKTYQWDAEGRMKSINNPSGTCTPVGKACTTYNALGQKVVHAWPGSEIDWLYHPDGSEMADFMPTPWNDWGNTYFNLNGSPIAKYIGGVADGELYFFHSNAIGSTSFITSYNGDVVQKELFYPYGQTQASGDLGVGSYRFAKLRELLPYGETGTYMSQTRDYPSSFYRWLSPDPAGRNAVTLTNPQTWNMYAYVQNNPLTLTDPSGLCTVDGEKHNWLWCAGHSLRLVRTESEVRNWLTQSNVVGIDSNGNTVTIDWSKASSAQANYAYNQVISSRLKELGGLLFPVQKMVADGLISPGSLLSAAGPVMTSWGWSGSAPYRDAAQEMNQAGTHETLNGKIPTRGEATQMIKESGGKILRGGELGHPEGGVSSHTYPHINYETASGMKATVRVLD